MPNGRRHLPRNTFKQALAHGERQVGLWSGLASPDRRGDSCRRGLRLDRHRRRACAQRHHHAAAAVAGHARRHGRAGLPRAVERLVIIKRALDVGARSLLIPFVQNAEEARRAVAATRYPPLGIRGVSVTPRANDYGRMQNYHKNAHLDTCVLVQVETKRRAEGD